jgi:hypothetical protein
LPSPPRPEHPAVEALQERQEREDAAYAAVLAALDAAARAAAAAVPLPTADLEHLNASWAAPERPRGGGLGGALQGRAWDALAPALERQAAWNASLVRVLNAQVERTSALGARFAELSDALVRYAQHLQPLVDARDRVAAALATTRSELILEAFDRRLESLTRRLDRLALREELAGEGPLLQVAEPAEAVELLDRQAEGSLGALVLEAEGAGDLDAVARAARRALRPGGRIAVTSDAASAPLVSGALERARFDAVHVVAGPAASRRAVLARR